jgi:hypothetical protein
MLVPVNLGAEARGNVPKLIGSPATRGAHRFIHKIMEKGSSAPEARSQLGSIPLQFPNHHAWRKTRLFSKFTYILFHSLNFLR